MRKFIWTGITIIVLLASMCGCGDASVDKSSSENAQTDAGRSNTDSMSADTGKIESNVIEPETLKKEIAYEITTQSDYNKLALNFSNLVQDADLIVKIQVEDVNPFINNNGMIQTEITPIIQEVYKGSYNDEKFYVNGGEMLYDEFIQNETIKKLVSGHENPDGDEQYKGKYVRQSVDNQYIFNSGEEYIFFAKKRDDSGKFYSLYAYQGTFKINNGFVYNEALKSEEPLKTDICNVFNIQSETERLKNSESEIAALTEGMDSEFMISEEIFAEKINDLK